MSKTVADLYNLVGKNGLWDVLGVQVGVLIQDVRVSWGQVQYLISPEAGVGRVWVSAGAVHLPETITSLAGC